MHPSMARRSLAVRLAVFSLLTLLASPALGQSTGGRILGRVADPSGAVLANVSVRITNQATGVARETKTNGSGDYTFVEVAPGNYTAEFEQKGFKRNVQKDLTVDVNQVVTLNSTLQIGATAETVEVTSEAPLVDTTSTQLGTVVNDRAIVQLPLNQRDTYQFLSLQPGVSSQVGADLYYGGDNVGSVSVNGGRGRSNNFSVNGGDANDLFVNLPTVQPSPDSVEEFRILTNTFDAEYGRNSGSVVNLVTKSGTNGLHGNVYDFLRNKVLNSRGYFDTSKPAFVMNQFGGTLGGPIKKDRTFFFASYEGLRRSEGKSGDVVAVPDALERLGNFSEGPTFSGVIGNQGVADVLNSRGPTHTECAADIAAAGGTSPAEGVLYSDVFPNNIIPLSCQDPVAVDLLRFVPASNTANGFFQAVLTGHDRSDQATFRFDHHINDKQQFSAYYYLTDQFIFNPFNNFQAAGANVPGFGSTVKQRSQQWNLSHTWTLSNNVVNEFRFTYMREAQGTFQHSEHTNNVVDSCATAAAQPFCFSGVSDASAVNDPANNPLAGTPFSNKIGITPGLGPSREGVPDVAISGGFVIGNNFEGELPQTGNSFQWSDNITKVKGNHTFKFGADVRRMRFDQHLFFEVSGYYNYFGGGTNDTGFSDLYPNYLLGLPDVYQQGAANTENVRTTGLYLFGQDSWKIRPNLTLNYGLRWELNTPLTDIGKRVQTFRPGQVTSVYPCVNTAYDQALGVSDCNSIFPTGIVFPGDKGVPAGLTQTYYKAFAPRIGIAWSPGNSGKTSIRAGWGLFYNPIEQLVLEQFSAEPPFGGSIFLVETMFNTPFYPQSGGFAYPNPFNGIQDPPRGQPVDWAAFRPALLFGEFQPHMRSQYSAQYNFSIQRELAKNLVLQVGYVGSQGHRLLASRDLNRATPQTCLDINAIATADPTAVMSFGAEATCNQFAEDNQFQVTVPNGFNFHLPNGHTLQGTGQTIFFTGIRPFSSPNCQLDNTNCPADQIEVFSNIFAQDTIANSSYNSLQVDLEKRFSNGLQLQAAYTLSKSIDLASSFEDILNPFDVRRSRSLSLFDTRHRFVLSYYYELPIPKYSGVTGKLANGWAVSGITQFQAGFPVHLVSDDDNELTSSIDFSSAGVPDQLAPFHKLDPRKNPNNYGFDPNSFTSNASDDTQAPCSAGATFNCFQPSLFGRYGSAPRTICCGPGFNNWDISIQKSTPLTEKTRMEFRWDIFNLANHTRFFNPDGNVTDGTDFGRVKRAGDPRLMQVALKLYF